MATERQKQFIPPLLEALNEIRQIDPVALVQKEKLGSELCFEFALPLFIEIITSAEELQKLDLEKTPYGILQQLQAAFHQIRQLLAAIKGFTLSAYGNAQQGRDGLASSLEDQWNSIYVLVRALLGAREESDVKKEVDLLASQIRSTMQLSSDALKALNDKKNEAEETLTNFLQKKSEEFQQEGREKLSLITKTLEDVRNVAAEAGVSQTSRYFKDEANEHQAAAKNWLIVLIIMTLSLVGFSLFGTTIMNWAGTPEPASNADNVVHIRYLTQKGLIVFCLLFGLIWSGKNYSASRHNYVVNKHRNNALGSFQAFASSASDEQTKSAVLVQATQSIFSPQASGYVKTDGDSGTTSPIIEILRSVGGSKEK